MTWLSELITKAGEENWCTSTVCGLCMDRGFRLLLKERPREEIIDDLRTLPQEICDRYPYILRTVFADVSRYGSVDAGSDLLEPLENTPAGSVLKAAIHHARQRYEIWRADRYFCSPEAAKARAEARKQRIVEEKSLRNERRTKLDKELLIFREAIDQADFDRFFSELLGVEDPVVARAVGGIAYSVLRERLRSEELTKAELELLQRSALVHGGHWAKLLKMKLCVTRS